MNAMMIFSYSRAEAISDGVLVDVDALHPTMRREAGVLLPVAMTARVYEEVVEEHAAATAAGASRDGRLWDLLWMMRMAVRGYRGQGSRLEFRMLAHLPEGAEAEEITLEVVVGPGDDLSPVLTVMWPDED